MISVIDKPPVDESVWWRGKKEFEVCYKVCDVTLLLIEIAQACFSSSLHCGMYLFSLKLVLVGALKLL